MEKGEKGHAKACLLGLGSLSSLSSQMHQMIQRLHNETAHGSECFLCENAAFYCIISAVSFSGGHKSLNKTTLAFGICDQKEPF